MPPQSRVVHAPKAKPRKRERSKRFWYGLAGAFLIFLLLFGLWYAANTPLLRINHIEISGTRNLDHAVIEEVARGYISGSRWYLFPKNNFFLVSRASVEAHLAEQFPQAADVVVEKQFPHLLTVHITERLTWGVVCALSGASATSTSCLYLDGRGNAYEELSSVQGWLVPVIYVPNMPALGSDGVSPVAMQFFDRSKNALGALGANLISMTFSSSTPLDVSLALAEGWEIKVPTNRAVDDWMGVLKTVLEKEIGDKRGALEYVDLRFGNKVFYKYRN